MALAQKGAVSLLDSRGVKVVGLDAGVRRSVSVGVSQGGVAVWSRSAGENFFVVGYFLAANFFAQRLGYYGLNVGRCRTWTQRFWEASITASRVWP